MKTYSLRAGSRIASVVAIIATMMLALPASGQTSGQTPNQLASETADNSTADVSDDNASAEQLASAADSLSAYDVSRYGSLEGVVSNIATNTTEDEQQPPYYETFIAIENPVFAISQIRPEVIPGMQVTVDIIGGKRTVLDYILSPIKRASNVAFREI